jgi:ribosomal protein L31
MTTKTTKTKSKETVNIKYDVNGKYHEFWLNGELKERAEEWSVLMKKVKKYQLSYGDTDGQL